MKQGVFNKDEPRMNTNRHEYEWISFCFSSWPPVFLRVSWWATLFPGLTHRPNNSPFIIHHSSLAFNPCPGNLSTGPSSVWARSPRSWPPPSGIPAGPFLMPSPVAPWRRPMDSLGVTASPGAMGAIRPSWKIPQWRWCTTLCPTGFTAIGPSAPWRRASTFSARSLWRKTWPSAGEWRRSPGSAADR